MGKFGYSVKADKNQPEIVNALRRVGAYVVHIHKIKNAWDICVFYDGNIYIMEIKNPEMFPAKFWSLDEPDQEQWLINQQLKEGENECRQKVEQQKVKYHIVYCAKQAVNIILNKIK